MSGRAGPSPIPGLVAVLLCLVVVLGGIPIVTGQSLGGTNETPNLSVIVPDPTLEPGTTTEFTVQIENDARSLERKVYTAENVRATLRSGDSPITVQSGTKVLPAIGNEEVVSATFRIQVPRDIDAGEYTLPLDVSYTFTQFKNNQSRDVTLEPTVRIEDRARFAVVDTSSDVAIGDTGTLNVTVENVGSEPAIDGTMELTTRSGAVSVGGSQSDGRYIGRLAPGEQRTLSYEVAVDGDAERQPYALSATVSFEDTKGVAKTSSSLAIQLTPRAEQSFSVDGVASTLRVGEEGQVTGRVVNDGPRRVSSAVAVLSGAGSNVQILENEYAMGAIEAGESAEFAFDVEVSESAAGGPRQLTLEVRYRNDAGNRRTSEPLDVDIDVGPKRDTFDVAPARAAVEAGGSGQLVLSVTNTGEQPVTDISAKLFTNDPLSSSNDEAFVAELGPGETTEVTFAVSASGGALPKTYPVSLDFQYDDADGDTLLSDTYRVPVEVTEPEESGGPPIVPIVVGLVVIVGGALILWRSGRWPPWG